MVKPDRTTLKSSTLEHTLFHIGEEICDPDHTRACILQTCRKSQWPVIPLTVNVARLGEGKPDPAQPNVNLLEVKEAVMRNITQHASLPVQLTVNGSAIYGDLELPPKTLGLVIFIHGSGSSRFSVRNKYVAGQLNRKGLGTLLLDLLTNTEHETDEETMQFRFDIPLLAQRSTLATGWALRQSDLQELPIGLFGASTGAAAALITATELKGSITAVVSRGGRPDLAEEVLDQVRAPTLLIVGSEDRTVLDLNRKAASRLLCQNQLHIVPGATHLFEEPGALEEVANVASQWFLEHMQDRRIPSGKKKAQIQKAA